jgi:hypothetical protein
MSPSNKKPIKKECQKRLDGIRHSADPAGLADDADGKARGKRMGKDCKKKNPLPKRYVHEALVLKVGMGRSERIGNVRVIGRLSWRNINLKQRKLRSTMFWGKSRAYLSFRIY